MIESASHPRWVSLSLGALAALALLSCREAPSTTSPAPANATSSLDAGRSSPPFAYTDVQTSGDRTCATGNDGHAYRWGEGLSPRPVEVPGLRAVVSTRCFGDAVCGLDRYGAITCVGRERRGAQPGAAETAEKITGLPPASAFALNKEGGCAVVSGDLWCWRQARFTEDDFPVVEPVDGIHGVRTMHTSFDAFTCVTRTAGNPVCVSPFPQPRVAVIEKGRSSSKPGAATAAGLPPLARTIVEIAKWPTAVDVLPQGEHDLGVCAILPDGSTSCDVEVPRLELARAVSSSRAVSFFDETSSFPCVKLDSGAARCAEDYFHRSALGRVAETLGPVRSISVGDGHACALGADGLVCWGGASYGQLGDGTPYQHARPAKVPGISDAVRLSVGPELSCVVHKDGALSCWGAWDEESSTRGRATDVFTPTRVAAPFAATNVFVGSRVSRVLCAMAPAGPACLFGSEWLPISVPRAKVRSVINGAVVTEDNRAFSFGWEGGRAVTEPEDFDKAGIRIASLSPDDYCGVTPEGDVVCGHCGACNGAEAKKVMTRIHGAQHFVEVSSLLSPETSFDTTVCARTSTGTVECYAARDLPWGRATEMKRSWEQELQGLADVVQISAASGRSQGHLFCALTRAGTVHCLGDDHHGQRGARQKGSTDPMPAVMDLPPVVEIGVASDHACARTAGGDVYCWGENGRGGAPDGSPGVRATPVKVALPVP